MTDTPDDNEYLGKSNEDYVRGVEGGGLVPSYEGPSSNKPKPTSPLEEWVEKWRERRYERENPETD